jgi:hypothetical protein
VTAPFFRTAILHEDRADHAIGLKLAVSGLARHAPRWKVLVHCPKLGRDVHEWIAKQPNASLVRLGDVGSVGWNVKPLVLGRLLDDYKDIVWIDSDILLAGPVDAFFDDIEDDLLLATEETRWGQRQGGDLRTKAWGLTPARVFETTINSGVLRVTQHHRHLLRAWQTMLSHPMYRLAQSRPWYERPIHMVGDQEVLTALLGAVEFGRLPVQLLRRGRDIAQSFGPAGFTPAERLRSLFGGFPPFVHAMGPKPWLPEGGSRDMSHLRSMALTRYRSLASELSPYTLTALDYSGVDGIDLEWTRPRSTVGKLVRTVFSSNPALSGFPLAMIDHVARASRRALGVGSYSVREEFSVREHPFDRPAP